MHTPSTRPWVLRTDRDFKTCLAQLKVLADSTRLAVIRLLLSGPLHVGELSRRLAVEQSLLSHHLRVLRDAKLVEASRAGKQILYRITGAVQHSFQTDDAIDLGCCQLAFPGRPNAAASRSRRSRCSTEGH